jgi:predicted permease
MNGSWWVIFASSVSVYLGIAVGSAVRWLGWMSEEADQSLMRLVVRVLYPCLIFSVVSRSPALRNADNLLLPPLVGFGTVALGFAAAWIVARARRPVSGLADPAQRRTFTACVGMYNYGFIPIPLVALLFDNRTLGVLFVHNIGADLAAWTLGVMLLHGALDRRWWRSTINAPSITILIALAVNFARAGDHLPQFLDTVVQWMGQSSIPLSLVLIGAIVADEIQSGNGGMSRADRGKLMGWSVLLRLGILPLASLGLAWILPGSAELKRVMVVQAAMPAATFSIVMARHYGGDPAVALRVALSTSLVSLITIPLWITAGMKFLGLH